MAVFPQLERFIWFDLRLRRQRFPNATQLAEQFEISPKTAQRDISRLRDRLGPPMAYDRSHKGYYYTEAGFELPRLPATHLAQPKGRSRANFWSTRLRLALRDLRL